MNATNIQASINNVATTGQTCPRLGALTLGDLRGIGHPARNALRATVTRIIESRPRTLRTPSPRAQLHLLAAALHAIDGAPANAVSAAQKHLGQVGCPTVKGMKLYTVTSSHVAKVAKGLQGGRNSSRRGKKARRPGTFDGMGQA